MTVHRRRDSGAWEVSVHGKRYSNRTWSYAEAKRFETEKLNTTTLSLEAALDRWLAESCGWCWVLKGTAILTDRPERIRRDNANRLHSDDGPAMLYRDGFAIYAWHGQRLPASHEWIITDKARITADAVMAEPNAELRRIMLEVSGFAPILDKAKVIAEDVDGNGHPRRLMEARVGGDTIRVVDVLNGSLEPDGSRRRFILGAMPGRTPHEVIAASYGINPKHYREAVRT